jgi:hypothetical protein
MTSSYFAVKQLMREDGISEKAKNHEGLLRPLEGAAEEKKSHSAPLLSFAYHHIVAKDQLMNFWNSLRIIQMSAEAEFEFGDLMERVIQTAFDNRHEDRASAFQTPEGQDAPGDQLRGTAMASISQDPIDPVDPKLGEIIERMYQWMPGNIFVGPEDRWKKGEGPAVNDELKDPKDGFEVGAKYIISPDIYERLVLIRDETSKSIDVAKKAVKAKAAIDSSAQKISQLGATEQKSKFRKELSKFRKGVANVHAVEVERAYVRNWLDIVLIELWLVAVVSQVFPFNAQNWRRVTKDNTEPTDEDRGKFLINPG